MIFQTNDVLHTFNCKKPFFLPGIFVDFKKFYDFRKIMLKVGVKFSELNIFLLLANRKSRSNSVSSFSIIH
jgi:hypothetical protein